MAFARFALSRQTSILKFFSIALLLVATVPRIAFGEIEQPARKMESVSDRALPEQVRKLSRARVILAHYELIQKDFPETRSMNHDQIDAWLLEHTAYVSLPQVESKDTNTEIPVESKLVKAFRPPNYNRALVFTAGSGLIDSKGNGSLQPKHHGHGNGLATLGEAIREYLYQRLIQKVFDHSHSGMRTVGNYGVIDFGFRVIHNDGSSSQAGAILRQAHTRAEGYMSLLSPKKVVEIEKVLREYGITTTGTKRDLPYDLLNAQGTTDGAVIDFGGFLVVNRLTKPGVNVGPFGFEDANEQFFKPGTSQEVKADPRFRIPYELWGSSVTQVDDSKTDNPFIWSHELAESLANGTAQRKDAEQHLRNLLDPIDQIFAKNPRRRLSRCEALFN